MRFVAASYSPDPYLRSRIPLLRPQRLSALEILVSPACRSPAEHYPCPAIRAALRCGVVFIRGRKIPPTGVFPLSHAPGFTTGATLRSRDPACRKRQEMRPPTGRTEKRIRLVTTVQLCDVEQSAAANEATTENVSAHGARIVTTQAFRPSEQLYVTSFRTLPRVAARVVYCRPVTKGVFQVGLYFAENIGNHWPAVLARANS